MYIQKYHSFKEIEPDYLELLEPLMAPEFVSARHAKRIESFFQEQGIITHHYLFFSKNKNTPVGYSQCRLLQKVSGFFSLLADKKYHLDWSCAGFQNLSLCYETAYEQNIWSLFFQNIELEIKKKRFSSCHLRIPSHIYDSSFKSLNLKNTREISLISMWYKGYHNLKSFYAALPQLITEEIKLQWAFFHKEQFHYQICKTEELIVHKDHDNQKLLKGFDFFLEVNKQGKLCLLLGLNQNAGADLYCEQIYYNESYNIHEHNIFTLILKIFYKNPKYRWLHLGWEIQKTLTHKNDHLIFNFNLPVKNFVDVHIDKKVSFEKDHFSTQQFLTT